MAFDPDKVTDYPFYSPKTHNQIRAMLRSLNRRRWDRLQKDFQWVQREMIKTGLNPDDARFLL